ncbi:MAG: cysteine-rich repeat protein, partial [Myxococcota bacterium]
MQTIDIVRSRRLRRRLACHFMAFIILAPLLLVSSSSSAAPTFSDFEFGSGAPFTGITELSGVSVTLSSTSTTAYRTTQFANTGDLHATVTFTFSTSISEFHLDVARVRADEFITGFNIGDPTSLSGDLVNNLGRITTSGADDFGLGRLSWTGINTTTVSLEMDILPGGGAMTVDRFGFDVTPAVCGNSNLEPGEDCDDGPTGSDTCTPSCTTIICGDDVCTDSVESAASCPADCAPVCGDGDITHSEVCDGAELGGQDCTDFGYTTPAGLTCDSDCSGIDSNACAAVCGNSNLEPGEACDDGPTGSDTCTPSCTTVICGDDVCTDGVESAASCPEDCAPVCGDGDITHLEVCDGAELGGQDCTDFGYTTPAGLTCDSDCSGIDSNACAAVCGDGSIEPGEACDDTNTAADDGCSASCQVEDGWDCSGAMCAPVCGDGLVTGDEQCDDGALDVGDGCDADCGIEDFFTCDDGEPTLCDPDADEDGIADDDDNCPDDANADQADADD